METKTEVLSYEEEYHSERHKEHFNETYYEARAKVGLEKYFKGVPMDARVLDYGCGFGQNIFFFKNGVGFDISNFSVSFCRKKGINATTNPADLADSSFDYVFSSHALEHHPYPKDMLETMRSKLKPGRDLILVIPHERHGRAALTMDFNQHLYCWNFTTINNLLISCGYKIKSNRYHRGAAYNKLLFLYKINFTLYKIATNIASYLFGIKEIEVVATRQD
jgi:SAM-dependent methyltransferase